MLFIAISYLKFLLKSTNQHGVHSPFVYDFVTKGLYKKITETNILNINSEFKNLSKKEQKILSKIITYFNINKENLDFSILKNKNNSLYTNNINEFNFIKSNSFIIFHGIHQDKKAYLKWQEIIKNKDATVTIDLFYFGLIFFRKEQVKEHFNIRV
ncbi:hypothetical protein [Polaribacter ponticola]|uniref:Uncharacterized protein n=1 Tax=Polaribacter ponticola TaxID=2978475 RepID=A0ABT5S877_9FLAO|nr:hypothetical protein [Polaribacter sp. MSW5]MDD7914315.1 hypothetical protein [Polaribacter sp. MSW5]